LAQFHFLPQLLLHHKPELHQCMETVTAKPGVRRPNGERMNPSALTAAHRTLPFGTRVSVVNQRNGKRVVVRISDRGPFIRGRIIDLTPAGARAIGLSGLGPVTLTVTAGAG
jgi:rare lipoprotein A